MVKFFAKVRIFLQDHYHLLFKSAADNHLRIQNILKNSDGSYQLTVRFGSFTELKNYQKKLRRVTVSLSSAIAMVLVAFVISPYILHPNKSAASTFLWNQTNWGTHTINPDTTVAVGGTNNTNWAQYNTNSNITASASGVTLPAPSIASTGDSSYSTATTGFYTSGGILKLLKPVGAGCGTAGDSVGNGECQNNQCKANECFPTLQDGYHLDSSGADINTTKNDTLFGYSGTGTIFSDGFESNTLNNWNVGSGYAWTSTPGHTSSYDAYLSSTSISKTFTSAAGTFSWSFWIQDNLGYAINVGSIDSTTITCTPNYSSWANCTGSVAINAGTHTFSLTAGSAYYDDVVLTGPLPFNGWDTTYKKVGTASANITTGTYLQPGSPITLGSDWTVAAWVYDGYASDGTYYLLGDGGSNAAAGIKKVGNYYYPLVTKNATDNVASYWSGYVSTWKLMVVVGTGNITTFYISFDGVNFSQMTISQQVTGNMSYIGNSADGNHPFGHIDELLFFNRALSLNEVKALLSIATPWQ